MKKVNLFVSIFVILLLPLLGLSAASAWATTYYVDATNGLDTNNGLTPATAWQTINKVNTRSFSPGDSILFNRGQIWREQLTVPSSGTAGNPITFGAYGSGANPKIYRSNSYNNWWEHSLIPNGGFEYNIIGTSNDEFTSWSNASVGSSVKADNTIANTGGKTSAKLTAAGAGQAFGGGSQANIYQTIGNIKNSTTYYFRVWGRVGTSGNNALVLTIKERGNNLYLDSNGVWQSSSATSCVTWNGANINTWVQKAFSFTTPPSGSTSLQITFYNFQTGNAWVDDVYLVQGNAPTSQRIWAGTINGNSNYWGAMKNGNRVIQYINYPKIDPFTMANEYFNAPLNGEYFYYREDSGNPGTMEIGVQKNGILVRGKSYVTIDGIDVAGPGGNSACGDNKSGVDNSDTYGSTSVQIDSKSNNVNVKNSEICNADYYGLWSGNTTSQINYQNLIVHDNGSTGMYMNSQGGSILNCKSYNNARLITDVGDMGGIGIYQGGNITISGNEVYRNGPSDKIADSDICLCAAVNPVTITKNYVHDCFRGAIGITEGGNNSIVTYNIIKGYGTTTVDPGSVSDGLFSGIRIGGGDSGVTGVTVANNIISGGAQPLNSNHGSVSICISNTSNIMVANNVFSNNINKDICMDGQSNITYNHNVYNKSNYANNWRCDNTDCSSLSTWRSMFKQDSNSFTTDPLFSDASGLYSSATDFIPKSGSPCRGAGINLGLTQDFCGAPVPSISPDIGAYQITTTPAILPTSQSFSSGGGSGSISVSAAATYSWSATSNNSWITINQVTAPQGNGVVSYSVTPNTATTTRQGSITVAGLKFIISQDAASAPPPSTPVVSPTSQSFSIDGGSGSISVSAAATYPWSATSNNSWVAINQVTATEGNGVVSYSVTPNTATTTRQGFIAVAGQQVTISQAADSPPSISPASQSFSSGGGSGSINVSAPATYSWSEVDNASWITISSATATQGNGTLFYSVAKNTTTSSRQATITIAGQQFSVTQAAASFRSVFYPRR